MGHIRDRWEVAERRGKGRRWQARIRGADGREHSKGFDRKIDAQAWVTQMEASKARGEFIDPRAGDVLFADYARDWLARGVGRPATLTHRARDVRLYLSPTFGDYPLRAIRPSMVAAFIASLSERGLGAGYIRAIHAHLGAILTAAVNDRLIPANPALGAALPEVPRTQVTPPTAAQVATMVEVAPEDLRAFVIALAGLGLRRGEARGLTVDRIDFLRRTVRVDRQMTPTGFAPPKTRSSVRVIPMPAFVAEALSSHIAAYGTGDDGLLFPASIDALRQRLIRRWQAAGVPATIHGLRHYYASVLIAAGESPVVVAARLGHANPSMTLGTYAHLWPDDDERTRAILDEGWSVSGPRQVPNQDAAGARISGLGTAG